jgi:6-phosphogluconolactonase
MPRFLSVFAIALAVVGTVAHGLTQAPASSGGNLLVYIGTYTTGNKSKGIYMSRLDTDAGTLSPAQLAAETPSPSFLAVNPTEKYLYAVNEAATFADGTGGVSAFEINRTTGMLRTLGQQSSEGAGPAHLSVDKSGKNVLVANYGGGSIAVLPITRDGGVKSASFSAQHKGHSVDPQRQKEPHAHSITMDPAGRFAYVADLGLDWIVIYQLDERKGLLSLADPPNVKLEPGSGPRHFSVHPSGRFGYVINELTCTVSSFTVNPSTGELKPLETVSALPPKVSVQQGYSGAELVVHPSGHYLYTSIRGHNSIALFTIDENTGKLTYVDSTPTQGNTPRGFGIDPQGRYLLVGNQNSDSVVVFRIDPQTGKLTATGSKIDVGAPVSFQFVR